MPREQETPDSEMSPAVMPTLPRSPGSLEQRRSLRVPDQEPKDFQIMKEKNCSLSRLFVITALCFIC